MDQRVVKAQAACSRRPLLQWEAFDAVESLWPLGLVEDAVGVARLLLARCCLLMHTHAHASHALYGAVLLSTRCDFALGVVSSRQRSIRSNLEYVILAGSSVSP